MQEVAPHRPRAYPIHPAAEAFTLLDGNEYIALRDDIAAHGLRMPLVLTPDGALLDGRNRWRACVELGIEPPTEVYGGDPVAYVVSLNIARRHLNESQRAMVAARLANIKSGVNQYTMGRSIDPPISQPAAAALLNVSTPTVKRAAAVLRGVEEGTIPVESMQDIEQGRASVSGVLTAHRSAPPVVDGWWAREEAAPVAEIHGVRDDGDNLTDEPLTPYEARIAEIYDAPSPAPEPAAPEPAPVEPARSKMAVHYSSATPEWYTPAHIVAMVRDLFGGVIDLDPCSNSASADDANVPARARYDRAMDGLTRSWRVPPHTDEHGDESHAVRAYVNPPYGDQLTAWVERTIRAYESGEVTEAVLLVPGRPGSEWWRRLRRYPVCFPNGRLLFVGADTGAPFPSALFYLGTDVDGFVDVFGQPEFGEVRAPLTARNGNGKR